MVRLGKIYELSKVSAVRIQTQTENSLKGLGR